MASNLDIIVEDPIKFEENEKSPSEQTEYVKKLVSWVISNTDNWADYRDVNYEDSWNEYYRIWRGKWTAADKTRGSERSKLITPATQQAIEATVAELEEATFGKGKWFDIEDDVADEQKEDIAKVKELLLEDMDLAGIPSSVSEIYLNGAIYGTGIGRIIVEKIATKTPINAAMAAHFGGPEMAAKDNEVFSVRLESVSPRNFVIDPSAKTVDEAMGCAVQTVVPMHTIIQKQRAGIYFNTTLGAYNDDIDVGALGEKKGIDNKNDTKVLEYFGLVPKDLLDNIDKEDNNGIEFVDFGFDNQEEYEMVEALITIANDTTLLKAVENPYVMKDRPIIAYQHDTVPDRFWGRGIAEKGYNPQKALDAELRARIDGLALTIHPMMAGDATRLPRGMRLEVAPGNTILTNGPPRDALMPFNFGNMSPATFHQSGELERMIQMGTGAMDSATPISQNARNSTASGMSMIASGAIKRSKRTMQNIERHLLVPLINKTLWRYMQFDPDKYTPGDYKFVPMSTMGIMAREYEQQQLTNLISTVPPNSPAYWLILKGIFGNSSMDGKEEMLKIVNQQMQSAMNPQPPPPDPMVQVKMQELKIKAQQVQSTAQIEAQRLQLDAHRVQLEANNNDFNKQRIDIEAAKAQAEIKKKDADSILAIAKAKAEEVDSHIAQYSASVDNLKAVSDEASSKVDEALSKINTDTSAVLNKLAEISKNQNDLATKVNKLQNVEKEIQIIEREIKSGALEPNEPKDDGKLDALVSVIENLSSTLAAHIKEVSSPKKITRDKNGRVVSVNGKAPKRDEQGLIEEI